MKKFFIFFLFIFSVAAQAQNSCLGQGKWGYITSPERTHFNFLAHEINGIVVLHKCDQNQCEIFQRGTYPELCQIERSNNRLQRTAYGVFGGIANATSAARMVFDVVYTNATMSTMCPGTATIQSLVNRQDTTEHLQRYFEEASHLHVLPWQRTIYNLSYRNNRTAAINNFASRNFQHTFTTPARTNYFQQFGEVVTPLFRAGQDRSDRANYCGLFVPVQQPNQQAVGLERSVAL